MPAQNTCPECGLPLPPDSPHGLCPRCLLQGAESSPAPPADSATAAGSQSTVAASSPLSHEKPGDRIGRYKLLQKLGEGGCGIVYMAEQEEPVKRRVALKVIKLGMDTRQVIARFEAERQALALMDHPHIAKVLDGGATSTGSPYFVMELVRGIPITRYCDENRLDTTQRLELFILVCHAVQHAHQKGIIHRDIKPSNILVADNDGTPVPKVIDFGIAKATAGQTLTDKTLFTAFEQFMGTPAYMSPEQAKLSGIDIDTRSDIYSLGVLLYELLTGKPPFEAKRLIQAGLDEICRIIREEEPPRPSVRLSTLEAAEQTTLARQRQVEPPKLLHLVRGDLDWIVMRTLEKDRNRRYETANGLASDLRRYLSQEPVVARPPSNLYRFQKMVRRNTLAFGAAAAIAAALLLGVGISTWLFLKERAARQESVAAEKKSKLEASKSLQVAQFLKDMLSGVGPSVAKGRDTAMLREILDKTAERVGKDLTNQPEVEMELWSILVGTYSDLAIYRQAEEIARGSLDLGRRRLGPDHPACATALADLGAILWHSGKLGEAASVTREALDLQRRLLGKEHKNIATSLNTLGNALSRLGKFIEAEAVCREALTMQRKLLGNEHPDVAVTLNNLGNDLSYQGKLAEAEAMQREALTILRKHFENEHPDVARTLGDLGSVLESEGKFAEAEALQRESLAIEKKLEGSDHRDVAVGLCNLGNTLSDQGKMTEAETALREALAIQRRVLDHEHPELASTLCSLGALLSNQARWPEAEAMQREALAIQRKLLSSEHPDVETSLNNLGITLQKESKFAEAEALYREVLSMQKKRLGNEHADVADSLHDLSIVLKEQDKLPEAESVQREALAMYRKMRGDEHPDVADSLNDLGALLGNQTRWPEAEALYREALAIRRKVGNEDKDVAKALNALAYALANQGKLPEAEAAFREALSIRRKLFGNENLDVVVSLNNLGGVLRARVKLDEAEALYREALAMQRRLLGAEHLDVAKSLSNVGEVVNTQGRLSEAEALYREALAMRQRLLGGEHPDVVGSLNHLVDVLEREQKYDEAEKAFSEVLTPENAGKEQSAGLFSSRGGLFARRERWTEASSDLTNAIALDPSGHFSYLLLATVLAELGDRSNYRRYCVEALARFGQTTDPQIAERIAKTSLILATADLPASDMQVVNRLANLAVKADTNHWAWHYFEFAKGFAEYREGHFESAAEWMHRVLTAAGEDLNRDVEAYMLLAMAQARVKRPEEAHCALAEGVEIAERKLPKPGSGDLGDGWNDWVIAQLLMREAKSLIDAPLKMAAELK